MIGSDSSFSTTSMDGQASILLLARRQVSLAFAAYDGLGFHA